MFITHLWRQQPGKYFLIATKSASGRWKDRFFSRSEFNKVPFYVQENKDKNVYACPHGFSKPIKDKRYAVPPRLFYADLDGADPRKIEPEPTIAIESSPGRYVGLWQADSTVTESLNRRLTHCVGADLSGWDFTQVLRILPHTFNYKYDPAPRVRLMWDDGPFYSVYELRKQLPKLKATGRTKSECEPQRYPYEVARKIAMKCKIYAKWSQPVTALNKRSSAIWSFGLTALEHGYSADKAVAVAQHSRAFDQKYGDDPRAAAREIERLRSKWA